MRVMVYTTNRINHLNKDLNHSSFGYQPFFSKNKDLRSLQTALQAPMHIEIEIELPQFFHHQHGNYHQRQQYLVYVKHHLRYNITFDPISAITTQHLYSHPSSINIESC
uniref:Uncharacterized protein n=1 Tax=Rhizophora mucronata TaxID=61149 RepID=A0A2P2NJN2_RHIMU